MSVESMVIWQLYCPHCGYSLWMDRLHIPCRHKPDLWILETRKVPVMNYHEKSMFIKSEWKKLLKWCLNAVGRDKHKFAIINYLHYIDSLSFIEMRSFTFPFMINGRYDWICRAVAYKVSHITPLFQYSNIWGKNYAKFRKYRKKSIG